MASATSSTLPAHPSTEAISTPRNTPAGSHARPPRPAAPAERDPHASRRTRRTPPRKHQGGNGGQAPPQRRQCRRLLYQQRPGKKRERRKRHEPPSLLLELSKQTIH